MGYAIKEDTAAKYDPLTCHRWQATRENGDRFSGPAISH